MKYLVLFFISFSVYAVDCKKHPIYCQITKNKPSINKNYAMKLSNIIYKTHKKYNIPSRIFTAILMQESGYNLKASNCHRGLYQKYTENQARNICHTFDILKFNIV